MSLPGKFVKYPFWVGVIVLEAIIVSLAAVGIAGLLKEIFRAATEPIPVGRKRYVEFIFEPSKKDDGYVASFSMVKIHFDVLKKVFVICGRNFIGNYVWYSISAPPMGKSIIYTYQANRFADTPTGMGEIHLDPRRRFAPTNGYFIDKNTSKISYTFFYPTRWYLYKDEKIYTLACEVFRRKREFFRAAISQELGKEIELKDDFLLKLIHAAKSLSDRTMVND